MTLLSGSSLWTFQNDPNDDSCECQVLVSSFDSNEPPVSALFTSAVCVAGKNNDESESQWGIDCNDGACETACSLKWSYRIKSGWVNLQLRLSCEDWNEPRKIPVDLSAYKGISFFIKGTEAFAGLVKVKLWTAASGNEQLASAVNRLPPSSIGPDWQKVEIPIKDDPNLYHLDFRRTHAIEFIDSETGDVTNEVWIDQICLIPDSNSTHDITIENDKVAFKLTPGQGSLFSLGDKETGIELLSGGPVERRLLYSLAYLSDTGEPKWTNNCLAKEFSGDLDPNSQRFSGRWLHRWDTSEAEVLVTAELPTDSSLATWRIDVNVTGDARLETLEFPILVGLGRIGSSSEDDRLLYPSMGGKLFVNPIENRCTRARRYPSGFASMQFMAYYDALVGFFVSSLDTRRLSKRLAWQQNEVDHATIKFVHEPLSVTENSKSFEMAARFGVFHGDWTRAASIYRDWALKQPWAKDITSKETPDWLTRIGIGKSYEVYPRHNDTPNMAKDYNDWADKIIDHNEYFQVPTLASLGGWENGGAWASGDYFPPQYDPHWALFDDAVQKVTHSGSRPYLFIRANGVTKVSPLWETGSGLELAVRNAKGEPIEDSVYALPDVNSVKMCLESEGWIEQLREWVDELAEHSVGIIQLDGFPISELDFCYSDYHTHWDFPLPACGTRPYRVAENLLMLRRKLLKGYEDVSLSSEYGAEVFLPAFDIYTSRECWAEAGREAEHLRQGLAESIPLFQFVYHSNILFLDMYNLGPWPGYSADPNYDTLAIGRSFTWGGICCYNMQNWLAAYESDRSFLDAKSLLKKCAEARVGFLRDFLVFGRMLPPPKVEGPLLKVRVEEGPKHSGFEGKVPSILTSAWQSERGDVAVIVLNIGDDANDVNVPLAPYSQYVRPAMWMYTYDDNNFVGRRLVKGDLGQEPYRLEPLHFVTSLLVSYPGDFSADGDVDFDDFAVFSTSWKTKTPSDDPNDRNYNPDCDISDPNDEVIDERDLVIFVDDWLSGKE